MALANVMLGTVFDGAGHKGTTEKYSNPAAQH
jgi:hypothetical protein